MNQNKNQLTTTTGNGVALRNASKSLKITNKLLAEVDDFDKHWEWWLNLSKSWRVFYIKEVLKVHGNIAFVLLEDHSHGMINLSTREVIAFDYDFYLVSDDFNPPRF